MTATPLSVIGANVWLYGASGLLAGEFARLTEGHPSLRLAGAVSREQGIPLSRWHPHLAKTAALRTLSEEAAVSELTRSLEDERSRTAIVLGLPHGQSARAWHALREKLGDLAERLLVVDLSADFRLSDLEAHRYWYGEDCADPSERERFVYGLPELFREELHGATRIAAPGCFATALQLSAAPAARAGLVRDDQVWVFDAITGSSGSGATPSAGTHHPHRAANLWAYRHEAELQQARARCGVPPKISCLPPSGPSVRGIHLTAHLPLVAGVDLKKVRKAYLEDYATEPFVEVLDEGVPDLRRVVGSNRAALALQERHGNLIVLLTLDNVVKGGAGQALQCLNLMLGLDETTGLPRAGLGVVG